MKLEGSSVKYNFREAYGLDTSSDRQVNTLGKMGQGIPNDTTPRTVYVGIIPVDMATAMRSDFLQRDKLVNMAEKLGKYVGLDKGGFEKATKAPQFAKDVESALQIISYSTYSNTKSLGTVRKNLITAHAEAVKGVERLSVGRSLEISLDVDIPPLVVAGCATAESRRIPLEVFYNDHAKRISVDSILAEIEGRIYKELAILKLNVFDSRGVGLEETPPFVIAAPGGDPDRVEVTLPRNPYYLMHAATGEEYEITRDTPVELDQVIYGEGGETTIRNILRSKVLQDLGYFGLNLRLTSAGGDFLGVWAPLSDVLVLPSFVSYQETAMGLVKPDDELIGLIGEIVKKSMRLLESRMPNKAKIKIPELGSDIEFTVFDSDSKYHSATEFVKDSLEGQIGTDGNVETLEIRPEPSTDPIILTENIEKLLLNLESILPPGHDLLGGGGKTMGRSTGLHIHFTNTSMDTPRSSHMRPEVFCHWLDYLLSLPFGRYAKGNARSDNHYGQPSDWRSKDNHREFGHTGFEYRTLATVCINRKLTQAVFIIAKMAIDTFEKGTSVEINENDFSVKWYKDLVGFDAYKSHIEYFVDWIKSKPNLAVPIISSWFNRKFEKDKECDILVEFESDDAGFLAIASFVMYNPQRKYTNVVIWSSLNDRKNIVMSEESKTLKRYLIGDIGVGCEISPPPRRVAEKFPVNAIRRKVMYIGIHAIILSKLRSKSQGSRNQIKIFSQDIIKNI